MSTVLYLVLWEVNLDHPGPPVTESQREADHYHPDHRAVSGYSLTYCTVLRLYFPDLLKRPDLGTGGSRPFKYQLPVAVINFFFAGIRIHG
jgi:hypothetical protein